MCSRKVWVLQPYFGTNAEGLQIQSVNCQKVTDLKDDDDEYPSSAMAPTESRKNHTTTSNGVCCDENPYRGKENGWCEMQAV